MPNDDRREDQDTEDQAVGDDRRSEHGPDDGAETGDPGTAPENDAQDREDQDQETGDPGDPRLSSARREAARYRSERNTIREERDTATAALDAARMAHAESLAGHLSQASDLWIDGATVADVLDEDGRVDRDAVKRLADAQIAKRPGLTTQNRQHGANGIGNNRPFDQTISTWSGAAETSRTDPNRYVPEYDRD